MSYKVEMRQTRVGTVTPGRWRELDEFEHDKAVKNDFATTHQAQVLIGREQDWDRINTKYHTFEYRVTSNGDEELTRLQKLESDIDQRIKWQQEGIDSGLEYVKEYALRGDRGSAEMHLENVLGRVQEVKLLENLKKGIV